MLTLHVKHGKSSHPVTVKQDTRMSEVMQILEQLTEVPTRQQKLICQGKGLDLNSTVESLNLRQGSKLMLMTAGGQTQVRQDNNSDPKCATATPIPLFQLTSAVLTHLQGQDAVQKVIKEKAAAAQQRTELFKQKQGRNDKVAPAMTLQVQSSRRLC